LDVFGAELLFASRVQNGLCRLLLLGRLRISLRRACRRLLPFRLTPALRLLGLIRLFVLL
jgi:hypothetical protein